MLFIKELCFVIEWGISTPLSLLQTPLLSDLQALLHSIDQRTEVIDTDRQIDR